MVDSMHDLAVDYALDALRDEEREAFETHLVTCRNCRLEVAAFLETLSEMTGPSGRPPHGMRSAVMDRVASTAQEGRRLEGDDDLQPTLTHHEAQPRPRWTRPRRLVAAAVGIAAVLLGAVFVVSGSDDIDAVLTAADAVTVAVGSEAIPRASVVFSAGRSQGVFQASGLDVVADDETYQLWLIGDAGPTPAGLFRPSASGDAEVLIEGNVTPGIVLGLTVEPAGGSSAPTGEILLASPIGS